MQIVFNLFCPKGGKKWRKLITFELVFTTNPKVWPDYFVPIQLCCDVKNHVCPNIEYLTSSQTSLLYPTYIITKTNKLFAFEIIKKTSSVHKVQTSTRIVPYDSWPCWKGLVFANAISFRFHPNIKLQQAKYPRTILYSNEAYSHIGVCIRHLRRPSSYISWKKVSI
jgi:hypothetical protein